MKRTELNRGITLKYKCQQQKTATLKVLPRPFGRTAQYRPGLFDGPTCFMWFKQKVKKLDLDFMHGMRTVNNRFLSTEHSNIQFWSLFHALTYKANKLSRRDNNYYAENNLGGCLQKQEYDRFMLISNNIGTECTHVTTCPRHNWRKAGLMNYSCGGIRNPVINSVWNHQRLFAQDIE